MTNSPRMCHVHRILPALMFFLAALNFLSQPARADGIQEFVMPNDGYLSMQFIGGEAAAVTTFGLGTSPTDFIALFTGLPNSPSSLNPVNVGFFTAGTTVHMGMFTDFGGTSGWAFSSGTDFASLEAFSDRDNSLGLGGSIIQQTGPGTYVLHLDDAVSGDDDDNDVLIRLTVSPKVSTTPEPGSALLLLTGAVLVAWRARGLRPNEH